MNAALRELTFPDAVVTESIRWVEQQGPLDDAEAMRTAVAQSNEPERCVARRAAMLGERLGLQAELARMRHWAPWMLLAIVVLIVIAGLGAAGNVIGGGERRINVIVALVGLLGVHLLTLLVWLLGLVVSPASFATSLGGLWLALTARVAGGRRGQAPLLVRAATGLLTRARLLPWTLGFVSHTIWAISFAVVLAALLFALAFRNYTLTWETTILDPAFFVNGVRLLGVVPSWLGFPVPDAQTVLLPAAGASGQRVWALWLTGCVLAYGLVPRMLLAALCLAVWQTRKQRLRPDFSDPYYRKLITRFDALRPPTVLDADPGRVRHAATTGLAADRTRDALWVVGFELPDDIAWPPTGLHATVAELAKVDGSAAQRTGLLDRLTVARPARVLLACHGLSSPDRGTERFLREVQAQCGECRLCLLGAAQTPARWRDWLTDAGLGALQVDVQPEALLNGWQP
ncbi:DUF2868 domain-containing protein [Variovorax sp. PAMC 28711]|uniref:DUF2868 domain-containing protein n=1 Tax=Variovorax sp. PAMC 28711 TaxID=1795631 RepID=UPI00078BCE39|nr:DUF2868 domain-containing protein [Variovorax sp. PAMC 28711]AMM25964.1 hypothetical protein AX767_17580 [Variovorax sp. PAMC 28711]